MLIISNNCISGFLQRDYFKQAYNNPFIWTTIEPNDFINLVLNFDSINFKKFELFKDKDWNFFLNIDNCFDVRFTHYKFNANTSKLTIGGPNKNDIFYNKIWEYIVEKYTSRLNRMLTVKEEPTFLWCGANDRIRHSFDVDPNKNQLNKMIANAKYKTAISFKDMPVTNANKNVQLIPQTTSFKHINIEFGKFLISHLK